MMSSLYIGATGLKSHGEGMNVITHNLSNVNTVGFKQISLQYADLVSQAVTAPSNTMTNFSQKGAGATPNDYRVLHTQGGYESSNEATDISINGIGFFGVTKNGKTNYTRSGNFRFDNQGALLDPNGWNVVGHPIVNGVESPDTAPIKLDLTENGQNYMAPKGTSKIHTSSRLGGVNNKSSDTENPFFSMASSWTGDARIPLSSSQYSYKEGISFYDSAGNQLTGTIYYDKAGQQNGYTAMEYVVALNPGQDASGLAGTQAEGLLLAGTMTFTSSGEMAGMTAFTPPASGNPADLAGWAPAAMNEGQPIITPTTAAGAQTITLDFGLTLTNDADFSGGAGNAAGLSDASVYTTTTNKTLGKNACTAYGTGVGTTRFEADGYTEGYLRDLQVMPDGTVRGQYTNNQDMDLARITTYRFTSQDGLRHEGNNHYSATPESGEVQEGTPGTENFGKLQGNALELSNVDYAREFSLMIVTQRGFQMNSKVITTSDTMLQKALELKR